MSPQPGVEPPAPASPPVWMRKGTLWLVLVLTTAAFALIAYYLLPLWWAGLVSAWVDASNSWITGLVLGFIPVTVGSAAVRAAWQIGRSPIPAVSREAEAGAEPAVPKAPLGTRFGHRIRPVLSAVAGLSIVVLALTIFIALGVTEPLSEAQQLWRDDAPGVLVATLVGALLGIIAILGLHSLRLNWRQRASVQAANGAKRPSQVEADEEGVSEP